MTAKLCANFRSLGKIRPILGQLPPTIAPAQSPRQENPQLLTSGTLFGEKISIQGKTVESGDSVKLLGVQLDYKLNFDPYISELCRNAATQTECSKEASILYWLRREKVLAQSFVYSNFNYCPLVWHFCSSKSTHKIEKIQERALRFLGNDHVGPYNDPLLKSRCRMHDACFPT